MLRRRQGRSRGNGRASTTGPTQAGQPHGPGGSALNEWDTGAVLCQDLPRLPGERQ